MTKEQMEEFEKWWIKKYQHTIESSYVKYVEFARDAWQAQQVEIDALKAKINLLETKNDELEDEIDRLHFGDEY